MEKTKEEVYSRIKDRLSIQLTKQRRLILAVLVENQNRHLSAAEVYSLAKEGDNKIGLATVYRTLNLLSEKGILAERKFNQANQATTFYEWNLDKSDVHYHLVCKECGRVIEKKTDFNYEDLTDIDGFQATDCWLEIEGYCSECQ